MGRLVASCVLGCALAACGEGSPVTYCEVEPILEARCIRCHGQPTQNHAPFPLTSYAATQVHYVDGPIYEKMSMAVRTDAMPPLTLAVTPPVADLSAEQIETIGAWADAGAPSGGCE